MCVWGGGGGGGVEGGGVEGVIGVENQSPKLWRGRAMAVGARRQA